mgnify:CR=1 FL=1
MHVVLVHPEIAPNTGNIIRLCANTGARLHLVEPLGFDLDDRLLKRGGLDYHEYAAVSVHPDLAALSVALAHAGRWYGFSSGGARSYSDVEFGSDDVLVFGAERVGLSPQAGALIEPNRLLVIPMRPDNRSLNLANAVAIVVYEAWRQQGFDGAGPSRQLTSETPGGALFDR